MHFKQLIYIQVLFLCSISLLAQEKSYKRGISYNIPSQEDVKALGEGLSWYYNWGNTPSDDESILNAIETYKLDFIPMVWGRAIDKDRLRAFYQKNPQVKYILGFNEPNFTAQANIGPKEAASRWYQIEEIADEFGLKIVGPAMNYAPSNGAVTENGVTYTDPFQYLDAFFDACPDCKVDYLAAHCYMNYSSSLKWYLDQYKKYGKPIWLTEFCAWESNVTQSLQKNYLVEAVNCLESDPDVGRYAWFIGRTSKTGEYPYMQLLGRSAGQLTDLGKIYVNMSAFDKDYYYKPNDTVPAKNYVEVSNNLHLDVSTDVSGVLTLADFYADEWAAYNLDVEKEGEYYFTFRIATQFDAKLSIYANESLVKEIEIPPTGGLNAWKTFDQNINLSKGQYKLKLKSNEARINLNWWIIRDKNSSAITANNLSPITVYPNPVKDIIHISGFDQGEICLTDCMGKLVLRDSNKNQINVSQLPRGSYLLTVKNRLSGILATYKIIK